MSTTIHTFHLEHRLSPSGFKQVRFSDRPDEVFRSCEELYASRGLSMLAGMKFTQTTTIKYMPLDEDLTRYTAPPDTGFNPEKEEDIEPRRVRDIGNFYGGLSIKMTRGVCYWSIKNYDGEDWVEIPRYLFDAIEQHLDE